MTVPIDIPTAEVQAALDAALATAGGIRALARATDLSPTYVHHVVRGHLPISGQLAAFLGFERVTVYRRMS